jgi:acetoin utilization protein AcuB
MLVKDRMTKNLITIAEDTPISDALQIIREKHVRRLPVLDRQGRLVGIVAEKDLLYASPSPATSLSVHELHYLLSKIAVRNIMKREVVTITEDMPLEDAARLMVAKKIGSLPVLHEGKLTGIITESDIFKTFVDALGGGAKGLRLTLGVPEKKGVLAGLTAQIAQQGGNIVSLVTLPGGEVTVKVQGVAREALLAAVTAAGASVRDVREV